MELLRQFHFYNLRHSWEIHDIQLEVFVRLNTQHITENKSLFAGFKHFKKNS